VKKSLLASFATLAALVLLFGLLGSKDRSQPVSQGAQTGVTTGYDYKGPVPSSTEAGAGYPLTYKDVTITATPLVKGRTILGRDTVCTTVDYQNNSADQINLNQFDWNLQTPEGVIVNSTFAGSDNDLDYGAIIPGGRAKGDVCFEGALGGRQLVSYKPSFWSNDKLTWIN
jgi:hypothetical protein